MTHSGLVFRPPAPDLARRRPRIATPARGSADYLDDLARCGPRLAHPLAMQRADAIAGFVSGRQGELAAAGLPVDRRAELILCAASLRCAVAERRWARARVACARIAATLDTCLPAKAPACSAGAPDGGIARAARA